MAGPSSSADRPFDAPRVESPPTPTLDDVLGLEGPTDPQAEYRTAANRGVSGFFFVKGSPGPTLNRRRLVLNRRRLMGNRLPDSRQQLLSAEVRAAKY